MEVSYRSDLYVAGRDEDGQEVIKVNMKVISVGAEFIKENGLRNLSSNAQSTLQVAEAWSKDQIGQLIKNASQTKGSDLMTLPSVLVGAGSPFTIDIGDPATMGIGDSSGSSYTLGGTISPNGSGGYTIKSELERSIPPNESE